ncbi:hypothetical protein ACNKU7_16140 [Microbulbifer sp. SA54]|uniref:hypothetical protein n=1 Tax=Microbulbifer sp. SA54 TaxID=3401577 RepID=UPI003AAC590A
MKRIHLLSGLLFLVVFAVTGQYMLRYLGLPDQEMSAERMTYRASHMYLLFVGAINVVIGCYWIERKGQLRKNLQNFGSLMIVISQPVLLSAFLIEPQTEGPSRDITFLGCLLVLGGVILSLGSSFPVRQASVQETA